MRSLAGYFSSLSYELTNYQDLRSVSQDPSTRIEGSLYFDSVTSGTISKPKVGFSLPFDTSQNSSAHCSGLNLKILLNRPTNTSSIHIGSKSRVFSYIQKFQMGSLY